MYMSKSKTKGAREREGKLTIVDGARCSKNELCQETYRCLLKLYKSGSYLIKILNK